MRNRKMRAVQHSGSCRPSVHGFWSENQRQLGLIGEHGPAHFGKIRVQVISLLDLGRDRIDVIKEPLGHMWRRAHAGVNGAEGAP